MSDLLCPHCGVSNPAGSAFCEACGKALPTTSTGPTVATAGSMTSAGRQLVGDDLRKTMKKAFTALMIVAVLQTFFGPVLLMVQKSKMERENPDMVYTIEPWAYAVVFGIALLFWVLALWARRNPLPAAITGLVVFVTLHVIEAVADPTSIVKGFLMKIIVVVMLVAAIKAGIQHRKLEPVPA